MVLKNENIDISIIIPVYNGGNTIAEIIIDIQNLFAGQMLNYEIILVDNNSLDNSKSILNKYSEDHYFKVYFLNKNHGQQFATLYGLVKSSGDILITLDDNINFKITELENLIVALDCSKTDVIYGVYSTNYSGLLKLFAYRSYRLILKILNIKKGYSIRIITRNAFNKIISRKYFYVNIDEFIFQNQLRVQYFPLKMIKRNKSKLTTKELLKIAFRSLLYSHNLSWWHYQILCLAFLIPYLITNIVLLLYPFILLEILVLLLYTFLRKQKTISEFILNVPCKSQ